MCVCLYVNIVNIDYSENIAAKKMGGKVSV